MMTVVAIMAGLLPIMWSSGTGSEVMRRIAAPMVGGMVSSTVLTLVVIPALYSLIKQRQLARKRPMAAALPADVSRGGRPSTRPGNGGPRVRCPRIIAAGAVDAWVGMEACQPSLTCARDKGLA